MKLNGLCFLSFFEIIGYKPTKVRKNCIETSVLKRRWVICQQQAFEGPGFVTWVGNTREKQLKS